MKKTTSNNLSKRLTQYGALTAAIAGVANVNGQGISGDIYYSGIIDGTIFNDQYNIDLDGDGNPDFQIDHSYYSSGYINDLFVNRVFNANNGVLGNLISSKYVYPFALNENYLISSLNSNWNLIDNNMYLNLRSCNYLTYSNWCGGESETTKKYLGLRFEFDGGIHYGWARLEIGVNPTNWVLKDYAYNIIPNESIQSGQQTTLGIDSNSFSKLKIFALNKSIKLNNLPQSTNYEVFSIAGQSILKGNTNQNTFTIEANTLAKGAYVLEIQDNVSKAVMRKKIVL